MLVVDSSRKTGNDVLTRYRQIAKARNAVLTQHYPVSVIILHTRSPPSLGGNRIPGSDDSTNDAFTVVSEERESQQMIVEINRNSFGGT